jgi:hypothetical protein
MLNDMESLLQNGETKMIEPKYDSETVGDGSDLSKRLSLLVTEFNILKEEVNGINKRNAEKDVNKEFEASWTRVIVIMLITYLALWAYMSFLKVKDPYLNAVVPTVGFNLSTWSLVPIKYYWMRFHCKY